MKTFKLLAVTFGIIAYFIFSFPSCSRSKNAESFDYVFLTTNLNTSVQGNIAEVMEMISDQMGLREVKYASFETDNDSLSIYFGTMIQGSVEGYWIALEINEKFEYWSTVDLSLNESLSMPADFIDITFNNGANKISVYVLHHKGTNEIHYSWMKNRDDVEMAVVKYIDLPIKLNEPFPDIQVELLDGTTLNTKSLKGYYVVINWWSSSCGPCLAAIPGLNEFVDQYQNNENIIFLAVAFDQKARIENILSLRPFEFMQSIGDQACADIFGESVPKYVIIDPHGIVTHYSSGGSKYSYQTIDYSLKQQLSD